MQLIGVTLVITGLLGAPFLALAGLGVPIKICSVLWVVIGAVCFGLWKHKRTRVWLEKPVDAEIAASSTVLLLIGILFASAGAYMIAFGAPSPGPRAMSRDQIALFGSAFVLVGLGVCCLSKGKRSKRGA